MPNTSHLVWKRVAYVKVIFSLPWAKEGCNKNRIFPPYGKFRHVAFNSESTLRHTVMQLVLIQSV